MNILVTGANGFVGSALIPQLLEKGHHVTALVRSKDNIIKTARGTRNSIKWIEGDLLDPENLPAIKNIEKAFYLVHGLKEQTAAFEYQESLAAVNFISWLRPTNAGIIYLGGLGPEGESLSAHLRSRHLTGSILGSSGLGLIEFRASIILGDGSLSFEMIKALSERIPFRPEFAVLNQKCQPMALKDLLSYLEAALERPMKGEHEIFEIGGPDVATYGELLDMYSDIAGLKRKVIKMPDVESKVLMKALDYAIPEHANSGKKMTESLDHPTIVTNESARKAFPSIQPVSLRTAMELAHASSKSHYAPLWEKDFLKSLLSDKLLTQSGLISPDLLKNLEKVGKLRDILSRK